MCRQPYQNGPVSVNPDTDFEGSPGAGSDAPGWDASERATYDGDRQKTLHARHRAREFRELKARLRFRSGRDAPVYSLELGSTHTGDRRAPGRVAGLELVEGERQLLRVSMSNVQGCGTRYGAYRRYIPTAHGMTEERLVCQHFCGSRLCERCAAEIRRRECARVAGNWRLFITLGCPPSVGPKRVAWFRMARARSLFLKRLERHAALPTAWAVRVWPVDAQAARDHRSRTRGGRQRKSELDYAWCFEPHQSGYPHMHLVVNACFVWSPWLRKVWGECIGKAIKWAKIEIVYNNDGVCRYLSKYISKAHLTTDLLALLYKKRLWGTSIPKEEVEPSCWIKETETGPEAAAAQAEDEKKFPFKRNWKYAMGAKGKYHLWTRSWCAALMSRWWPIYRPRRAKEAREAEIKSRRDRKEGRKPGVAWMDDTRGEWDSAFLLAPSTLTEPVKVC